MLVVWNMAPGLSRQIAVSPKDLGITDISTEVT